MRKTHFIDGQFIPQPHPTDPRGPRFIDRTGMKSPNGKIEILFYLGKVNRVHYWCAACSCGNRFATNIGNIDKGSTSSCGCHKIATAGLHNRKHGKSGTVEFNIWRGITKRCTNPKVSQWHRYGGRGVCLCDGWKEFANFLSDVGLRPTTDHQIDRIDNDGHYSCGKCSQCVANGWTANCKWSTRIEQTRNTRRNHFLFFRGENRCISEWAEVLGLRGYTIHDRLRKGGMSVEEALSTPMTYKDQLHRKPRAGTAAVGDGHLL